MLLLNFLLMFIYLFFEREHESRGGAETQGERERIQAGSVLPAQNPGTELEPTNHVSMT